MYNIVTHTHTYAYIYIIFCVYVKLYTYVMPGNVKLCKKSILLAAAALPLLLIFSVIFPVFCVKFLLKRAIFFLLRG